MPVTLLVALALSNLLIGFLVGGTGIGGFLLPVMLTGLMAFPVREAFTLSFIAFTVCGVAGAWFHWKDGNLDVRRALIISAGSIPGALLGVRLNTMMPVTVIAVFLYGFILLSSISLLVKKPSGHTRERALPWFLHSSRALGVMGFFTSAFCTFAGAGGPILVIPILTLSGLDPKESVGTALLNSVFIGLTASFGYSLHTGPRMFSFAIVVITAVTIGALAGHRFFRTISGSAFTSLIAVAAGVSSLFLLIRIFL
ncbi:MAG: sulfite exporter TauE/SafE family protein [Sphaerochaetaceae bacterium]|nr:sulfite exporter TauE/SafE family protein [Sphaerochaetaceae bacterium]